MPEQVLNTKRICDLEVGDCFIKYGVHFKVKMKSDIEIFYNALYWNYRIMQTFGIKNKSRVEIILPRD